MFREAFQSVEWAIAEGSASGIHGIEEVIGSLASLDFINEDYLNAIHKYDPLVTSIMIFVFVATIAYCMLFDSKEISKSVQRLILACICLSLFSSLFTFVVEDVGATTVNSIQETESTAFGLANSLMNFTVKDYENSDNDYYLDSKSWEDIEDIDILEELDKDVEECDSNGQCEIIAEKGDYRYEPSLIFTCLVGLGLFVALLFVGVILANSLLELVVAGLIGPFVIAWSVLKDSPFGKNYVNYVVRTVAKVVLLVVVLQSYFTLSDFMTNIVSNTSFNILQEGLVFLMIQCSLIMYMFNGSALIEKVFGMELGMSKQLSSLLGSKLIGGGLESAIHGGKKVLDGAGDTLKNTALGGIDGALSGKDSTLSGLGNGILDGSKQSLLSKNPYRREKQESIGEKLFGDKEEVPPGENETPQNAESETQQNNVGDKIPNSNEEVQGNNENNKQLSDGRKEPLKEQCEKKSSNETRQAQSGTNTQSQSGSDDGQNHTRGGVQNAQVVSDNQTAAGEKTPEQGNGNQEEYTQESYTQNPFEKTNGGNNKPNSHRNNPFEKSNSNKLNELNSLKNKRRRNR